MEKRDASRLICDFLSGKKISEDKLGKLSPADWQSLAERAQRFKVEGLFYRAIKSPNFPTALIPEEVRSRLRNAYRAQATLNTSLFLDAAKVLMSFAENHLPVIALKGLALAKSIYGDIALRPMSDIDLLLKEEDLVKAGRILLAWGYEQEVAAWESMLKTYHHLPPFENKNGTVIELHGNIVTPDTPMKVDIDGLWARACFIKVDDTPVRVFSSEDQFLHLCIHACFHLQTGLDLIPFCDLAGLMKISGGQFDWPTAMERAGRWGGKKCVYLMLLLTREMLGAAPPEKVMAQIKPDDDQPAFFEDALKQIFDEKPSGHLIRRRVGKLENIKRTQGIQAKVAALGKEFFPSKEYMAGIYPLPISSKKIYLCYVFRLGRLALYFASVFLRLFRRDRSAVKAVEQARRVSAVSDWLFS